jgi:hypothetical protein
VSLKDEIASLRTELAALDAEYANVQPSVSPLGITSGSSDGYASIGGSGGSDTNGGSGDSGGNGTNDGSGGASSSALLASSMTSKASSATDQFTTPAHVGNGAKKSASTTLAVSPSPFNASGLLAASQTPFRNPNNIASFSSSSTSAQQPSQAINQSQADFQTQTQMKQQQTQQQQQQQQLIDSQCAQIAALQSQIRVEDDDFAQQMQREKEMQRCVFDSSFD